MSEITREFLQQHIARMGQQIAAFQGALEFADMLLKHLDQQALETPTMTVPQLQEAINRGQEKTDG